LKLRLAGEQLLAQWQRLMMPGAAPTIAAIRAVSAITGLPAAKVQYGSIEHRQLDGHQLPV
jgi:hypothetical protein